MLIQTHHTDQSMKEAVNPSQQAEITNILGLIERILNIDTFAKCTNLRCMIEVVAEYR